MAKVLADGTGAAWAQVWLVVNDDLVLAATWPPTADADPAAARRGPAARATGADRPAGRRGAGRAAAAGARPAAADPGRGAAVRRARRAGRAGAARRPAARRARRSGVVELSARAEELRVSRERLVDTQDAERRRLERDIHDGAQQHLVALAVNLRLAQTLATRSPERAQQVLAEQSAAAAGDHRHPGRPVARHLPAAARPRTASGRRCAPRSATSPVPVTVNADGVGRFAADVEAAVYFCCLEAAAERRQARRRRPDRRSTCAPADGGLALSVTDDGRGFDLVDRSPPGTGWRTCATGSTRSAAASPGSPPTAAAPRSAAGCRRPARPSPRWAECAPGSPGCWPASARSCAVGDTVVVAAFQPLLSEASIALHGWPLVPLAALGSAVMGAVIVSRYPRHPIGWLLSRRRRRRPPSPSWPRPTASGASRRAGPAATGPASWPGWSPRCSAARWRSPAWPSCSCSRRTATCSRGAGAGRWSPRSSAWCCSCVGVAHLAAGGRRRPGRPGERQRRGGRPHHRRRR